MKIARACRLKFYRLRYGVLHTLATGDLKLSKTNKTTRFARYELQEVMTYELQELSKCCCNTSMYTTSTVINLLPEIVKQEVRTRFYR
jgi:hypothetical protein